MSGLDQAALQGGILCGYGCPRAAHLFVAFGDRDATRRWLGALLPGVTPATPWTHKPERMLNVALSLPGLAALGVPTATLAAFPEDVRQGMAARAQGLRDTGRDAPEHWEEGLDDRAAHAVVTVHARDDDEAALRDAIAAVRAHDGVRLLATEVCRVLPEGREHFGFRDGLAQPALAGDHVGPWHGLGNPGRRRPGNPVSWEPSAVGEFVLGHADEDGDPPEAPPAPFDRETSYLVLRKLRQDVAAWRAWLLECAGGDQAGADAIAAKLMGRWPNGTPVSRSPDAPDPALDDPALHAAQLDDPARRRRFALLNDFGFDGDERGDRCPITAHIRRANPRDAFGDGRRTRRHRIARRGMPYGPPVPQGTEDDGADRGLWFACFQASIRRQFELIQRDWLNDGDAFGCGADRDVVAGACRDGEGKAFVNGRRPRVLGPVPRVVTLRGGGYFVAPSIPALDQLAR